MRRLDILAAVLTVAACGAPPKAEPSPAATGASSASSTSSTPSATSTGAVPPLTDGGATAPIASAEPTTTALDAAPSESDPQAALATAKKDGKPAFIVFCAKWVAACGELAHVLVEAGVKKTLEERFVVARVDVSNEDDPSTKERMKKYNVKGLPSMIVFDRKGKEVGRETGYVDSSRISKLLEKAK